MAAQYDGPGVYEVELEYTATFTVTVRANDRGEALRRAREDVDLNDPGDMDEVSAWAHCVHQAAADTTIRERLTPLEEALWMITGKVPAEAVTRIEAELQAEQKATA